MLLQKLLPNFHISLTGKSAYICSDMALYLRSLGSPGDSSSGSYNVGDIDCHPAYPTANTLVILCCMLYSCSMTI